MVPSLIPTLVALVALAATFPVDPDQVQDLYAHSLLVAKETRGKVPGSSKPIFDLARVHQRFGFDDLAVEAFRESLRADPHQPQALFEMGFLLSQRFQDQALAAYRQALLIHPQFPRARTRIGLILVSQGRHQEGVEEFRAEISNRSADAFTYTLLGHALKDLGKFSQALTSYQEAIRLDPEERGAYYGQAEVLKSLGRKEESARVLKEFQEKKLREARASKEGATKGGTRPEELHKTALTYLDAARTYLEANLPGDGERCLRAADRFDPADTAARQLLVDFLRRSRRLDEAIVECRELLRRERSPDWLFLLAGLSTEKESYAEAGTLLEEAIRAGERQGNACRELARLILRNKVSGDHGRALELARKAVEAGPGSAVNHDVLSWALYLKGDLGGTLEALETAARLDPQNASYQKRLAELHRRAK